MASSIPPICPWKFLDPSPSIPQKVSFANVLKNGASSPKFQPLSSSTINALQSINIPLHQLPSPSYKGEIPSIKISEDIYKESLLKCNSKLLGRLIFSKGHPPLKSEDLHLLLSSFWTLKSPWKLTPRGKGFYSLHFDSLEDQKLVWMSGTIPLKAGFFKLLQWSPDFMPSSFISSTAHVWIRLLDLPEEYWHPRLLMEIARGVGLPIRIDPATLAYRYGLYARILVEVDFSFDLPSKIIIEREGFSFSINIAIEHPPAFCDFCGIIGNSISTCKRVKAQAKGGPSTASKNCFTASRVPVEGNGEVRKKLAPQVINVPDEGFVLHISDEHMHGKRPAVLVQNAQNSPHNVCVATAATVSSDSARRCPSERRNAGIDLPCFSNNILNGSKISTNLICDPACEKNCVSGVCRPLSSPKTLTHVSNSFNLLNDLENSQDIVSHPKSAGIERVDLSDFLKCTTNQFDLHQLSEHDFQDPTLSDTVSSAVQVATTCPPSIAEDTRGVGPSHPKRNAAQRGSKSIASVLLVSGSSSDGGPTLGVGLTGLHSAPPAILSAISRDGHGMALNDQLLESCDSESRAGNGQAVSHASRAQVIQLASKNNEVGSTVLTAALPAVSRAGIENHEGQQLTSKALLPASSYSNNDGTLAVVPTIINELNHETRQVAGPISHSCGFNTSLLDPTFAMSVQKSFSQHGDSSCCHVAGSHDSRPVEDLQMEFGLHALAAQTKIAPTLVGPGQSPAFSHLDTSNPIKKKFHWASLLDKEEIDDPVELKKDGSSIGPICFLNKQASTISSSSLEQSDFNDATPTVHGAVSGSNFCSPNSSSIMGSNYEDNIFDNIDNIQCSSSSASDGFSYTKQQRKAMKKKERLEQLQQDQINKKLADVEIEKIMAKAKQAIDERLANIRKEGGPIQEVECKMVCFMQEAHKYRDACIEQIKKDYNLPETRSKGKKKN